MAVVYGNGPFEETFDDIPQQSELVARIGRIRWAHDVVQVNAVAPDLIQANSCHISIHINAGIVQRFVCCSAQILKMGIAEINRCPMQQDHMSTGDAAKGLVHVLGPHAIGRLGGFGQTGGPEDYVAGQITDVGEHALLYRSDLTIRIPWPEMIKLQGRIHSGSAVSTWTSQHAPPGA